jgi:hypothetical protein
MRAMVQRFAPQNQAPASNNLARILVDLVKMGIPSEKSSTLGATGVAQVRSRWRGEDGVHGIHFVLRIFVMAHLVFILICATCGTHQSRRIQAFLERRISSPTKLTADVIATATAT